MDPWLPIKLRLDPMAPIAVSQPSFGPGSLELVDGTPWYVWYGRDCIDWLDETASSELTRAGRAYRIKLLRNMVYARVEGACKDIEGDALSKLSYILRAVPPAF